MGRLTERRNEVRSADSPREFARQSLSADQHGNAPRRQDGRLDLRKVPRNRTDSCPCRRVAEEATKGARTKLQNHSRLPNPECGGKQQHSAGIRRTPVDVPVSEKLGGVQDKTRG